MTKRQAWRKGLLWLALLFPSKNPSMENTRLPRTNTHSPFEISPLLVQNVQSFVVVVVVTLFVCLLFDLGAGTGLRGWRLWQPEELTLISGTHKVVGEN